MGWARLDDAFDDNPKILALLNEEGGVTAIGLWVLCLAWAHRNTRRRGQQHGKLPSGLPRRYLGVEARDAIQLLVKVGLWDETDDGGWLIHDFGDYLPSAETRDVRSEAGKQGAAKRWAGHVKKTDKMDSDGNEPSQNGKLPSLSHGTDGKPMASDGSRAYARRDPTPVPEPVPEVPYRKDLPSSDLSSSAIVPIARHDVEQICTYLADKIEQNGSLRPTITEAWRNAARLMIDRDGRTVPQILRCIDWAQSHHFWRTNVMSMPKLRKQYDRLRLQAQTEQQPQTSTAHRRAQQALDVAQRFADRGE